MITYSVLLNSKDEKTYIEEYLKEIFKEYDKSFGDDRVCNCGHPYYRHFDTYNEMYPCGCKYCECREFNEKDSK